MNNLTLQYGGTTQSLEDWGFSMPRLNLRSRTASLFTVVVAGGDPAVASAIPYNGLVILRDADLDEIIFVGYRKDRNGSASGRARNVTLQFLDSYSKLTRTTYQFPWQNTVDGETFTTKYTPRGWLFQNIPIGGGAWAYWTAAEQLDDIIDFAHTKCSIAIQPGTIDPPLMMPVYPVNSLSCSNCMGIVLQTLPDCTSSFDFTTTPPSLNLRIRQNCTAITLPWGGTVDGQSHSSSEIKSRDDLQVSEVMINYRTTTDSGFATFGADVYPPGSDGFSENAVVTEFDLRGGGVKSLLGTVNSVAIDPTTTAFWTAVKPDLANDDITSLGIVNTGINTGELHGITITIADGDEVELSDYPNKIIGGQVCPWMTNESDETIEAVEVTITAYLSYIKQAPGSTITQTEVDVHEVSCRLKLTNSLAGVVNYSAEASSEGAETPPPNFAYLYWCSQNNVPVHYVDGVPTPPAEVPDIESPENLQWEGWHEIAEQKISTFYNCTNVLNLTGGDTAWESMNATIESVEYDFYAGKTRINFGPHKALGLSQFFSIAMLARNRIAWDNPNATSSGSDSGGSALGTDTAKENTVEHSTPTRSIDGVVGPPDEDGNYWLQKLDGGKADGLPQHTAVNYTPTGVPVSGTDSIAKKMSDLDIDTNVITMKYRCLTMKRASDCAVGYVWVSCSDFIAGAPPSGAASI